MQRARNFRNPAAFVMTLLAITGSIVISACVRSQSEREKSVQTIDAHRLISLSPAISRTLVDLRAEHLLVGRSRYCDAVDPSIAVVGDLYDVDLERLVRLEPTAILVQPPASGVASTLTSTAEAQDAALHAWRLNSIADIRAMVGDLAELLDDDDVHRRARAIDAELRSIDDPPAGTVRTLLIQAVDPMLVAGLGTYIDELLRAAGGVNATTRNGWAELSLEDATRLDPAAIIILQAATPPDGGWRSTPIAALACTATREGRVHYVQSADAAMPSSAVMHVVEPMREALHRGTTGE